MGSKNRNNNFVTHEVINNEDAYIEEIINEEENVVTTDPSTVETTTIDVTPEEKEFTDELLETSEDKSEETTEKISEENNTDEISSENNVQLLKVKVDMLNIRKAADKGSEVVTVVSRDQNLTLIESEPINGFYHIMVSDLIEGYCMVDFVELI